MKFKAIVKKNPKTKKTELKKKEKKEKKPETDVYTPVTFWA